MRWLLIVAATNGFIAVAAGAFGAHALREKLSARQLDVFETGARYQLTHAVAMLAAAFFVRYGRLPLAAGWAFAIGMALFSGSLYALALTDYRALGMITPFGGVALLVGWALLVATGLRMRNAPPGD